MKRILIYKSTMATVCLFLSCASLSQLGYLPQGAQVNGEWNSDFGKVTFNQYGNRVEGLLQYANPPGMSATIEGTVQGRILYFKWWITGDPNGRQVPQGDGTLELSPEGQTLTGQFSERSNPGVYAPWRLTRIGNVNGSGSSVWSAPQTVQISGEWNSVFGKTTFNQNDNQVNGLLVYAGRPDGLSATIEGTIQGRTLHFNWWITGDPNGRQSPQGNGTLEISPDGRTMTGQFTDRNNPGVYASWGLTR